MRMPWTKEPLPVENDGGPTWDKVQLAEVVDKYNLVEVNDSYFVVAPKQLAEPSTNEIGYSGNSVWSRFSNEEYNPMLRGELGVAKYNEMRRSDAQVRMSLRLIKTPVIDARWYVEPASDSKVDREIAEFVWNNLTKQMTISWPQMLIETLLMLEYGWMAFEKVFEQVDGKIRWRKFAPRHPADLYEWEWDAKGGPEGIRFFGPKGASDEVYIPIDKLLVFTFDKEGGNMEGISLLRSAYKHWYFKDSLYKIDAIQKERHGVGIPVIKLPPGFSPQDKSKADELGRNLRTNEKAHIVLPPLWDIMMLKLEGQPVNVMESIEHHDKMIAKNILAPFMNSDRADNEVQKEMFLKGSRFIADIVRDVFNKWAIPELVRYNWGAEAAENAPELRVRRIGETVDWRTISFALRNLVGAKLLVVDEPLRAWIRDELDLPREDPATAVEQESPQNPNALPRQSPARGMKQQVGVGKSNTGQDRSGG
ncbi:MAG: DUF935 family protein [Ilumatobacteraceae bacterium]